MKKKLPHLILLTILMNFFLVSSVFAADVFANNQFIVGGMHDDFGYKNWGIYETYVGNQSEGVELGNTYQLVNNHDWISHCMTIYGPEIGYGENKLTTIRLQNSSGITTATISGFSNGNIRSFLKDPTYHYYPSKYSYAGLQSNPAGNYRIQWVTVFTHPRAIIYDGTHTSNTNYF